MEDGALASSFSCPHNYTGEWQVVLNYISRTAPTRMAPQLAIMYGPPSYCKGRLRGQSSVCVNVSGLLVEGFPPGHDDDPRVLVLLNRSATENHLSPQVFLHAV
jgi:hypothetical protein